MRMMKILDETKWVNLDAVTSVVMFQYSADKTFGVCITMGADELTVERANKSDAEAVVSKLLESMAQRGNVL